jgi:uncharacterized protein (DUF2062 family)
VFVGVFLGVVPLYGIQTGIILVAAWLFRLNKLTVLAAGQISMPFFAPFLIAGSIAIGEWMRFGRVRLPTEEEGWAALEWTAIFSGGLPDIVVSCFLGSFVLGALLGAVAAGVVYAVAVRDRRRAHARMDDRRDDGLQRRSGGDPE